MSAAEISVPGSGCLEAEDQVIIECVSWGWF